MKILIWSHLDGNFAISEVNKLNESVMTTISVIKISQEDKLKRGYITLVGTTGLNYQNIALYIPSYGWVPCSLKFESTRALQIPQ